MLGLLPHLCMWSPYLGYVGQNPGQAEVTKMKSYTCLRQVGVLDLSGVPERVVVPGLVGEDRWGSCTCTWWRGGGRAFMDR